MLSTTKMTLKCHAESYFNNLRFQIRQIVHFLYEYHMKRGFQKKYFLNINLKTA